MNPLYLRIAGFEELRPAPGGELIDYDAVWAAKAAALARLAATDPAATTLPDDPALRDFATYCALAEVHGRNWRDWPEPLRHPANPAVAPSPILAAWGTFKMDDVNVAAAGELQPAATKLADRAGYK